MIVTDPTLRLLAVGLVLAGAYAYLYSDLVVRRVGVYVYFAAFTLLWAELLIINLAKLTSHPSALIGALALTSLAANLVQAIVFRQPESEGSARLARPLPTLGLMLSAVPVLLGVILHLRATRLDVYNVWPYSVTWAYVAAMALTAICCRISAYLHERSMPRLAMAYLAATAAATLVGAAGLLSMLGIRAWPVQSSLLMLIPIIYLLASRLYQGHPTQKPLAEVAHAATAVLLFSALSGAGFGEMGSARGWAAYESAAVAGLREAAVFYALAAILYGGGRSVYLSTAMACGAIWQLLNFWSVRRNITVLRLPCWGRSCWLRIGWRRGNGSRSGRWWSRRFGVGTR